MTSGSPVWDGRAGAFRPLAARPYARARVVLFPHGGGSASYYKPWTAAVPWDLEFVAVQYPGREDRFHEPLPSTIRDLAAVLARDLPFGRPLPTVLFGHSMGALAAFEVARRMTVMGVAPARLVASGHPAPALARPGTVHLGDDDELIEELRRTEATNLDVLDNEALIKTYLPIIRNDYRLSETYTMAPGARLDAAVSVFHGDRDAEIDEREAQGWADVTDGSFDVTVFEGGHFYLDHHRDQVIGLVTAHARAAAARASAVPWPSAP
ncbi:thioesterase II family protein [Actinokineospora xionganensis]|uniref:Thioesterase n=1 Tax=Actinokineospora xionganensis TaxID=2684470 RepID=A0ABR7L4L0_9PSEU|nr:alpha/beta fold hydrolase [Actinokineospora xionganensis]MBC6447507.1 thioesterase [Actinokineospora xionganensis]